MCKVCVCTCGHILKLSRQKKGILQLKHTFCLTERKNLLSICKIFLTTGRHKMAWVMQDSIIKLFFLEIWYLVFFGNTNS